MSPANYSRFSKWISRLTAIGSIALASVAAQANEISCFDNIDCKKGEICVDKGGAQKGICVKRCAPLRLLIATDGKEPYSTSDGTFTRYKLKVTNWQQLPEAIFAPSPDLPPCGLNTNSARSWVDIIDVDTNIKVYGFCGLTETKALTKLWFGVKQGAVAPKKVQIIIDDRRTGRRYCSNVLAISAG